MNTESLSSRNVALLSFVAGAAVGALVVAFTTPKTGPQVREDLKNLGRQAKCKVGDFSERLSGLLGTTGEPDTPARAGSNPNGHATDLDGRS